jgi:hypothetical protein
MSALRWVGLTVGLAAALYLVEKPLAKLVFGGLGVSRIPYNWVVQIVATALIFGAAWLVGRWAGLHERALVGLAALATVVTWPLFIATEWLIVRLPISWDILSTQAAYMAITLIWATEAIVVSQLVMRAASVSAARLTKASA